MARKRRPMSEERREELRQRALRHPEWGERSREAFGAKYPERVEASDRVKAQIASGEITPGPCDRCGGEGQPLFDWDAMVLAGWRCYPCRKVSA